MKLILNTPTKLRIEEPSNEELEGLQNFLKYRNTSIAFQIRNLKKNFYLVQRYGEEWVNRKLAELESQLVASMLYTDERGLYTLAGIGPELSKKFNTQISNSVEYPEFDIIPWSKIPTLKPYEYQTDTVEKFLENPHAHAELATGLGKSHIILLLLKAVGLPSVVVTPSTSIAKQMYEDCVQAFGKKYVGMYGAGKKDIGKRFLICIGKSLSMVDEPELVEEFKQYQVFISDESHTLGADLFAKFSLGLLSHCPYRWFLSATQERNDGKDLLLQGIIGKQVYSKSIQQGIAEGYLAKISTLIFDVTSASTYSGDNIVRVNQEHVYRNKEIIDIIARISEQAVLNNQPTLILIDELEQEAILKNYMKVEYAFAYGGADVHQICKDFNEGKVMCVIGTSAVSTGTNFKPVQLTINWKANKAGTKVKQGAIGRSTRLDERTGKTSAKIIDFRVINVPMTKRHTNIRIKYYEDVGDVTFIKTTSAKQFKDFKDLS